MALPAVKLEQRYTYADYLKWDDGERWEIIYGRPYLMAPAPTLGHQGASGELHLQLGNFLKGKKCRVFYAPFDVRLFPKCDDSDDTIVQPDIVVVCDRSKLGRRGCVGAPDMVIEILSPSNARHDILLKFHLYQKAGVREYWIVDPEMKIVSAHILKDGEYVVTTYGNEDSAPVHVLEGLSIDLSEVFIDEEEQSLEFRV